VSDLLNPGLLEQLQWLKERYGAEDFTVEELDDDDPVLRAVDGTIVDTWREGYPYPERLDTDVYERQKRLLQIELLKMQRCTSSATSPICQRRGRSRCSTAPGTPAPGSSG
jgi:hypothetical protein